MGWQTSVITNLEFNRKSYDSSYQVESDIEENKKVIQNIKEELLIMATSRPEDLLIHNEDMDILSLSKEVRDKLECFEECIIDNYKLSCLKENFDLRDGDFIKNPCRKQQIKQWLISNYILDECDFSKSDFNTDSNETITIKNVEGD